MVSIIVRDDGCIRRQTKRKEVSGIRIQIQAVGVGMGVEQITGCGSPLEIPTLPASGCRAGVVGAFLTRTMATFPYGVSPTD